MLVAQITDTHIKRPGHLAYGVVDTTEMLKACVKHVLALDPQPDLIVLTGDLVDMGTAEEYAHLRTLLAPLLPRLLVIPGNHDERHALAGAFPEQEWRKDAPFLQYACTRGPLRIIGLDTVVSGEGRGALCEQRLGWLERTLMAAPAAPTLILMHHPPFVTGIAHMDRIGLAGREAFAAIVAQHPQVRLILCGHLHRSISTQVGGCRALTSPSPAHQVAFDLRADGPSCFRMEPPGYMLHAWNGEDFVSHAVAIGDYVGPYPFFDAQGNLLDG
jgi:3',5'-cyclic AMP phosphodiesterase CpdA